jgi:hypothetical protein
LQLKGTITPQAIGRGPIAHLEHHIEVFQIFFSF